MSCNDEGCGAPYAIRWAKTSAWAPGTYRVEVTIDGELTTCTFPLPATCGEPVGGCDRTDIPFGISANCGEPSLSWMYFHVGEYETVQVKVFRNEQGLGSGTFHPDFHRTSDGCKSCNTAGEDMVNLI